MVLAELTRHRASTSTRWYFFFSFSLFHVVATGFPGEPNFHFAFGVMLS